MMKRKVWMVVWFALILVVGWLLRGFQEEQTAPLATELPHPTAASKNGGQRLPETANTAAEPRESPRHAADDLENYRRKAKKGLEQNQKQIAALLEYDNDQLMVFGEGLHLANNLLRENLPKYKIAKGELELLQKNGMGTQHPTVKAKIGEIDRIKAQLDQGANILRATLIAQSEMTADRIERMNEGGSDD